MRDPLYSLELKIAQLLRGGVLVAGFFLLLGWLMTIHPGENTLSHFQTYQQIPFLQSLEHLWQGREWGLLIAYFGLGVLISLPLLRVLMTAFLFFKQKEMVLAGLALVVLIALGLSFSLGFEI